MKNYDYLIVGSGLFGSIFARQMTDAGASCLVIDKRSHIGGNCYTRNDGGIDVHEYGPHIFHTSSDVVWNYMKRWTTFNHFVYRPKVSSSDSLFSFPINLFTLYQLWGVKTPQEAMIKLEQVKVNIPNPRNVEEWVISQVGEEIYEKFIKGYTTKQWGRHPTKLPASIVKRLPIRLTHDDNYFEDCYQGIPTGGYTSIFEKLLNGIDVEIGIDYLKDREKMESKAKKIVYTGAIDEFFEYSLGTLEWRSLKFEHQTMNTKDYQGVAVVNYTDESVPQTRVIEHKHFTFGKQDHTVVTREYPQKWDKTKEKFYPVNDDKNNEIYRSYRDMIDTNRYIFGGRLADYKYYDMHQVVGSALVRSEKEIHK
ncbi:MAG TPA: UDP-galactopyranose mutase [Crocinitomicaceae bacterium]|nr:UDP-galactopyranose mutase [Crocinitomicaceae bacterium]